ncbi:hypothetical protein, partial [Ferrimicrobium acidiphilum]|uniref:hypothetical protein n=1 Tax=Ferrimicrobium acidiphilum TaxID=121039 RepID=UPI0023EF9049
VGPAPDRGTAAAVLGHRHGRPRHPHRGAQRPAVCHTFMRRVGIGGYCPSCDEPVAMAELVSEATERYV